MTPDPIPHAPESGPSPCKAPDGICVYMGRCNTNRYGCHAALANPTPTPSGDEVAALRARVQRLEGFVDYVIKWRDRGPPHGGDPVTAWSAVSWHPVVTNRARAALSQAQGGENGE